MKNRIGILILPVSLFILDGCLPYYAVTIYNNTRADIVVIVKGVRYDWPSSHILRISSEPGGDHIHPGDLALAHTSQGGLVQILEIDINSELKRYNITTPGIPEAYIQESQGMRERYFQLEEDKCLYILEPIPNYPVVPPPPQPDGLPIRPVIQEL